MPWKCINCKRKLQQQWYKQEKLEMTTERAMTFILAINRRKGRYHFHGKHRKDLRRQAIKRAKK